MAYKNNIGPQVRRRRYNLGLSQAALAAKLQLAGYDISRSGVSKIEARLRHVDDKAMMFLADVLAIPIAELFPPKETGKPIAAVIANLETTQF
jgi:transcriptional regulator with XRE-family HTH domain